MKPKLRYYLLLIDFLVAFNKCRHDSLYYSFYYGFLGRFSIGAIICLGFTHSIALFVLWGFLIAKR